MDITRNSEIDERVIWVLINIWVKGRINPSKFSEDQSKEYLRAVAKFGSLRILAHFARKTSETDTLQFLKFKQRYVKMEGKMNSF